jgi:hypothetical protein
MAGRMWAAGEHGPNGNGFDTSQGVEPRVELLDGLSFFREPQQVVIGGVCPLYKDYP